MKKSKKLLSLLLCAFMVLGFAAAGSEGITQALDVFRVKASAETEVIYLYEVNDGKATITGYRGDISGDITIPSTLDGYPVTSIGDYVFSSNDNITSVTIPDSVINIGDYAFLCCDSLTSVILPDTVTSIGSCAFYECVSLTSITISSNLKTIGNSAFKYCRNLTSINLPYGLKDIGEYAFEGCDSLISVTIPDSVTSIGFQAFFSIPNIIYSGNMKASGSPWGANYVNGYVDGYLVYADSSKTTVIFCSPSISGDIVLPNTVTRIEDDAFYDCTGLTSIIIPDSVTEIGYFAFSGCTGLTSIAIPDSVTSMGSHVFYRCRSLTDIVIPESVTSIGVCTFEGCTNLTSVTIPNTVTSISYCAFEGCTSLINVTIPDTVTEIEEDVFKDVPNIIYSDNMKATGSPWGAKYVNGYVDGYIVYVDSSKTEVIFCSPSISDNAVLPNTVTKIKSSAFKSCTGLTSIHIPSGIEEIAENAFENCKNLKYICSDTNDCLVKTYAENNGIEFRLCSGHYKTGDIIEYGTYPQSKVTDSSLIAALNELDGEWISYNYYSGTGAIDSGNLAASDYMRYKDVSYNGDKYRAVTFDSYRPDYTTFECSASRSSQDDNGYTTGNVYWFRYEPLKWRVLDPSAGLVMCNTVIDSQAYNNYEQYATGSLGSTYYGDPDHTYYCSNYAMSSIRQWLNNDFYNTAFTRGEKINVAETTLDNSSPDSSEYDAPSTTDKVFLLSYYESINPDYGFNSSASAYDDARKMEDTDYAKCQGLISSGDIWWLRSPYSQIKVYGSFNGRSDNKNNYTDLTDRGVVPVLRLSKWVPDTFVDIPTGANVVYDGTKKTGVESGTGYTIKNNTATNAGNYTAIAALEDGYIWSDGTTEEKQISWTIYKATPTVDQFTFTAPENLVFDGTEKSVNVAFASDGNTSGMGGITVKYQKQNGDGWGRADTSAPTNAGTYKVSIDVSEGVNYNAASDLSKDDWVFTIESASVDIPEAVTGLVYDGTKKTGVETGTGYTLKNNTATNAGDYTAIATLEENYIWSDGTTEEKQISWTIYKATPTADQFIFAVPENLVFDGTEKSVNVAFASDGNTSGMGDITVKYQKQNGDGWGTADTSAPTNAGTYKVSINVSEGDNYSAASDLSSDGWVFTVECISVDIPEAETGLVFNDREQTGVKAGTGYTLENNTATNAGNYTAIATLEENYIWSDGTTEAKEIAWRIAERADYSALHTLFDSIEDIVSNPNDYNIFGEAWTNFSEKYSNAALIDSELENTTENQQMIDTAAEELAQATAALRLEKAKADAKAELEEAKKDYNSDEAKAAIDEAIENVDKATNPDAVSSAKTTGITNAENADTALANAKAEAKADLEEAKNNAVSDAAKAAIDTAIANVDKATNQDAVTSAKTAGMNNAENADTALANAKEEAKADLEETKKNAVSDAAKAAIDTAIVNVDKATNPDAVNTAKTAGTTAAANADTALANAKADAKADLEEAKKNTTSDGAKSILDAAITEIENATNIDSVNNAKANAIADAALADDAYAEKIKFDDVLITVAPEQKVNYKDDVTITASAENVPKGYKLAIYIGDTKVADGDSKSVTYKACEVKSDIEYTVKVIDANGNVQKDSDGKELTAEGGKITCKKNFFTIIIAFLKVLIKVISRVFTCALVALLAIIAL